MKTVAAKQPSSLACIKFWVVVTLIMLLILWVFAMQLATLDDKIMVPKSAFYIPYDFPPQRVYKNNGYLNVTLIVPKFAHGTYWNDTSKFEDICYVNHFITSLRDEVKVLKELPPEQKRKAEPEPLYYMFPMYFGSLEYYLQRCRVNYEALRFTQPIQETGRKIVNILREKGPFLVLHLRYEKDILAFTSCKQGLTKEEAEDVKQMKYSQDGWRHKPIASNKKRKHGLCPLTPEETALVLQALDIDKNITIYIAAEEIYNKEKRMADLVATYPNLLEPFMEHADQMAAMDYIVAIESDIFMPTFVGNMAVAVQGHRGYYGFKPNNFTGQKAFDEFSLLVKKIHEDRTGKREKRKGNPDHARQEDSFYSNPQDSLPTFASTIN
ncbi:hypothetical protein ES319_D13G096300v1 [Gossypium barbadense]|uniref:O-fucosyltransferase family protein n=2 Tax=Gossypium TaxID=3633 RepID=A0A5J5NJS7_GOSBA|nr:hypothetical protein ES319_D13G096300v1 [Gossypium barbadense]